jgi:hypothetical protein
MRTVPVNQSADPSLDGCEPLRLISILQILRFFSRPREPRFVRQTINLALPGSLSETSR